ISNPAHYQNMPRAIFESYALTFMSHVYNCRTTGLKGQPIKAKRTASVVSSIGTPVGYDASSLGKVIRESKQRGCKVYTPAQARTRANSITAKAAKRTHSGDLDICDPDTIPITLSLVDAVSLCRIETPVRSAQCKHARTCDRTAYIQFQTRQENRWVCPQCSQITPSYTMRVDAYTEYILSLKETQGVDSITVDALSGEPIWDAIGAEGVDRKAKRPCLDGEEADADEESSGWFSGSDSDDGGGDSEAESEGNGAALGGINVRAGGILPIPHGVAAAIAAIPQARRRLTFNDVFGDRAAHGRAQVVFAADATPPPALPRPLPLAMPLAMPPPPAAPAPPVLEGERERVLEFSESTLSFGDSDDGAQGVPIPARAVADEGASSLHLSDSESDYSSDSEDESSASPPAYSPTLLQRPIQRVQTPVAPLSPPIHPTQDEAESEGEGSSAFSEDEAGTGWGVVIRREMMDRAGVQRPRPVAKKPTVLPQPQPHGGTSDDPLDFD
ncbi:hypothetical protein KIPB_011573, partial [Kipferlia bialata]